LFVGIILLTACASSKNTPPPAPVKSVRSTERTRQLRTTEEPSIDPAGSVKKTTRKPISAPEISYSRSEKTFDELQFKYAILLDVPVEEVNNEKLFQFIESWYGTPYRYGGFTKEGIDCSGFAQAFMSSIYQVNVPRISAEQYNQTKRISRRELREGDLVFFKTSGTSISHVGIYLRNNKFVHASTTGGVMINDLNDDYYARRFAGSGRVK